MRGSLFYNIFGIANYQQKLILCKNSIFIFLKRTMNKEDFFNKYKRQRTFVMIKPDGVQRGLIGEIIQHFEKKVLKITAMKMIRPTEEQVRAHYPMNNPAWIERLGGKSLSGFEGLDVDPEEFLGTKDKVEIGKNVAESLVKFMTSGPVIIMIIEGLQARDMVRKIVWHTLPNKADMGTIRADYSIDTPLIANVEGRSIHNLIHASETEQEAENEIKLRFGNATDVYEYERTDEKVAYTPDKY